MKRVLIILLITACCLRAGSDSPIESIQALKEKSASGDHAAQYQLALEYVSGKRIKRNEPAAFELFLKSAKKGNAKAEYKVALAYFNGEGVLKNQIEGLAWMYRATEAGISDLQISSMKAVLNEADINRAQKSANDSKLIWYRLAAEQGDANAQYSLAVWYANGTGVAKDEVESVKWCRMAAEQGLEQAQFILGVTYSNGNGVPMNEVEAVKWYRKAVEQGDARSQYNLGDCYANGQGVAKDEVEAYALYTLAGRSLEVARKTRFFLKKGMTSMQVAKGERRANELQSQICAKVSKPASE